MTTKEVHRVKEVQISKNTSVKEEKLSWQYLDNSCLCANNLYNAAMFVQRNHYTAKQKKAKGLSITALEQGVEDNIVKYGIKDSPSGHISYCQMDKYMKLTKNPDYLSLPAQVNQQTLKQLDEVFKSFFATSKDYKAHPEKYSGKPKLPGYLTKGGKNTVTFTNQVAKIKLNKKTGMYYLRLPKTKCIVNLGREPIKGVLKEVQVVHKTSYMRIILVLSDTIEIPDSKPVPKRIASVDPGVKNMLAVVNNVGAPNLLFSSLEIIAMINGCSKRAASQESKQTAFKNIKHAISSNKLTAIYRKSNNFKKDIAHKFAKMLIEYCKLYNIDTIVFGYTPDWKDNPDMGKENNRLFKEMPHKKLVDILSYLCEWNGINLILQEESYTSKASFSDRDPIPVYVKGTDVHYTFSGKRTNRDTYRSADGTEINADFNGAANIMRKAIPDAFDIEGAVEPDFFNFVTINNPNTDINSLVISTGAEQPVLESQGQEGEATHQLGSETSRKAHNQSMGSLESHYFSGG